MQRALSAVVFVAWIWLAGCAAAPRLPPAPTLEEIVQQSRQGEPSAQIIARIRASRAVYPLTATELAHLHDRGVSNEVLDYLQAIYLAAVRADERSRIYDLGAPWAPYPWFGLPPPPWRRWH